MLKLKTTKKTIKDNYNYIMGVSYCKMQYMLMYERPSYYNAGGYGWACDNYIITLDNGSDLIISTGYDYIKSKNITFDHEILKKYENKASEIYYNYDLKHEDKKNMIKEVFNKYINTFLWGGV